MSATGSHLILPLLRPQYVMVPEALTTALAWSLYDVDVRPARNGKSVALMYRTASRETKTLQFRASEPTGKKLDEFARELEAEGVRTAGDAQTLARAAALSIAGIRSEKGGSQPASPMTEAMALLQNMRGLQGAAHPPSFDVIIETLMGLGASAGVTSRDAAERWRAAMTLRARIDPLSSALDKAIRQSLLDSPPAERPASLANPASAWQGMLEGTPFSWMARSWARLTEDDWVRALPARVWVDWASTVLRMGLGMGFLWEAAWYETIARTVLRGEQPGWDGLRKAVPEPLPWKPVAAEVSVRDVSSILSWRVRRSDQIRKGLDGWIKSEGMAEAPVDQVLARMSTDDGLTADLEVYLGSRSQGGANLWEAVRYALKVRDESGPFADHYGLLRNRGSRYLIIDPGTEWVAVMASLSCPAPGEQVDVRAVLTSLQALGLRPELSDLVQLLERAGLARGSADADQGVVVQSAF